MRAWLPTFLPALLALPALSLHAESAWAAQWQANVNYGGTTPPTMDLYVPDEPDAAPGVVVSLHYCTGTAQNARGWFQSLADQHGFIVIAPDVGPAECWNAAPQRSGEREAIVKMVQYVITEHGADPARVFAAGASSGACMTNALMAAYPEVFAGGSVLAGIPAGAWTTGNSCCGQNSNRSGEEWGNIVRSASSDFTGERPRLQLWHGTSDTTLNYTNLAEEVKQWTNVLGVTDADATMENNQPKAGWSRTSYTNDAGVVVLESHIGQNKPHDLTGENLWADVVRFFGLDMDTPAGGTGGTGGTDGGSSGGESAGGATPAGGASPGMGGGTADAGGAPSGPGAGGSAVNSGGSLVGSGGTWEVTTSDDGFADEGDGGCQTGNPTRPLGIWSSLLMLGVVGWARLRRRVVD